MYFLLNNKHRLGFVFFVIIFMVAANKSVAQNQYGINDTILHEAVVYGGDTIEAKTLNNIFLYSKMTEAQRAAAAKYNRLRNAVYVTYPFARKAGIVMNEMNARLASMPDKTERKKYIKSKEAILRKI